MKIPDEERGIATLSTVESMVRDASEHGVSFTRVGIENLLNPEKEDDVTKETTLELLGREVAGMDDDLVGEEEADEMIEEEPIYVEQELLCVAQEKLIIERNG